MTTRQTIFSLIGALLIGVAVGHFSVPTEVVVKTEAVEVDKKQSETNGTKEDHTVTVVTKTTAPDGTVTEVTKIRNDVQTETDTKTAEQDDKDTKTYKKTEFSTSQWTVSALVVEKPLHPAGLVYGGHVQYRILGPFQVGALALTDGTMGISLGVSF